MKVLNRRSQEIDYLGGLFISHTATGTPTTEKLISTADWLQTNILTKAGIVISSEMLC